MKIDNRNWNRTVAPVVAATPAVKKGKPPPPRIPVRCAPAPSCVSKAQASAPVKRNTVFPIAYSAVAPLVGDEPYWTEPVGPPDMPNDPAVYRSRRGR